MKKILAMALSVILIATLVISGTVAYLTDDESAVNVMTVGKVDIVLHEEQRKLDDEGKATADGELVEFVDGKNLMPVFGSVQGAENKDKWGMPTAKNYIDKIVRVENTGESDAWVRVFIGIPAALENSDASKNVLHWNWGNRFDITKQGTYNSNDANSPFKDDFTNEMGITPICQQEIITDKGETLLYNIYCFTRKNPLPAEDDRNTVLEEDMTAASLVGFYLDSKVDYDDKTDAYYIGEKIPENRITITTVGDTTADSFNFHNDLYIPVFAQAVQYDGFASAEEAFNAAFDTDYAEKNGGAKYNPWSDGTMEEDRIPAEGEMVTNGFELEEALKKGGAVTLTSDTSVSGNIPFGKYTNLNLQNNTLQSAGALENFTGSEVTVNNGAVKAGSPSDYTFRSSGNNSDTTFNDVEITSAGGGIGVSDGAKATFNSGSVYIDTNSTSGRYCFYAEGEGSVIIINDGSFSWDEADNQKRAYIYAMPGTTVYVNGGTFGKASTRSGYTAGILGEGTVIITGGTFGFNPSAWVATGYTATDNGDGTWSVAAT